MIKKTTVSILLMMIAALSWAGPVDQQQAEENVKAFFTKQSKKGARGIRGISNRQKSLVLEKVSEVADAYYVFNIQDGGFVIAAADDQVPAVLGYTDNGSFDADDIPDNMRGYLEGMAAEIQAIRQGLGTGVTSNSSDRQAIAPMVTTKWRQGAPFYYQCPTIGSSYCVSGCVATAMAQVMKYHEWPKEKCQTIPSYYVSEKVGTLSALPAVVFDWANMKDTYSTSTASTDVSAQAVAQLMRYCGQSVEMKYNTGSSSAETSSVVGALKTYFNYDVGVHKEPRKNYNIDDWNNLIYRELTEKRPVVISGKSSGGGHAFICDGYDADDYFHINWGWGGGSDAYFLLSVLNPYDNSGTGASTTRDGYSAQNYAIVGIQPPTENSTLPPLVLDIYSSLSFDGSTLDSPIWNTMGEQVTFDMGYAIKNEDGSLTIIESRSSKTLQDRYYTHFYFDLSKTNLSDGTYHIYPVIKRPDETEWKTLNKDYYLVTVKDGNISISIQKTTYQLSIEKYTLLTDGKSGFPQELSAKIENTSDKEFYGWLYLFIEGTDTYLARTGATVSAGKESDIRFFFTPTASGTFRIWIATDEKGENKIGESTVTFTEREKKVFVSLTPLNTRTENGVIYLTTTELRAQLSIINNTDAKATVALYATIKGPNKSGLWDKTGSNSYSVEAGQTKTSTFTSQNLQEGGTYTLSVFKDNTKTDSWQDPITFTVSTSTGIQGVTDNIQEKEPVYYDLQGRIVPHPTKGIYIVNKKKVIIK